MTKKKRGRSGLNFDSSTLIARLKRRSGVAEKLALFRPLVKRRVTRQLSRRIADRVDPSDVVQETLLLASRRLPDFLQSRPMPFVNWLMRLASQTVIDVHRQHIRSQRRSVLREEHDERSSVQVKQELLTNSPSPVERLEQREAYEQFLSLLQVLDPIDRDIIILRDVEGLSNQEAADLLDITPAAASKRHTRGVLKLKDQTSDLRRDDE